MMFRRSLIFVLLGYLALAESICVVYEIEGIAVYTCMQSTDYKADIKKIPLNFKVSDMMVRFITSDIPKIENGAFDNLVNTNVSSLDIQHSGVQEIEDDAFKGLTSLEELTLDSNRLQEMKAAWFKDLKNLLRLSISKNYIKTIDSNAFDHTPLLEDFRWEYNEVQCIDTEKLKTLIHMKRVHFLFNKYDWECALDIVHWTREYNITSDSRYNSHVYKVYDLAEGCIKQVTVSEDSEKRKAIDDCMDAKLSVVNENPELYFDTPEADN